MVNALLMFATAGIGFGGTPWHAFAVGASLIVLLGIPQQREELKRYRRQPKADIVLGMIFKAGLAVAGAFASAWAGYGLRLVLAQLLHR
jgi:hypothetical protein